MVKQILSDRRKPVSNLKRTYHCLEKLVTSPKEPSCYSDKPIKLLKGVVYSLCEQSLRKPTSDGLLPSVKVESVEGPLSKWTLTGVVDGHNKWTTATILSEIKTLPVNVMKHFAKNHACHRRQSKTIFAEFRAFRTIWRRTCTQPNANSCLTLTWSKSRS